MKDGLVRGVLKSRVLRRGRLRRFDKRGSCEAPRGDAKAVFLLGAMHKRLSRFSGNTIFNLICDRREHPLRSVLIRCIRICIPKTTGVLKYTPSFQIVSVLFNRQHSNLRH